MVTLINHNKVQLLTEQDILVIGAGSAGCLAALASRSKGNFRVMIVERYGFPGGSSTQMLDTFYGFFTPGDSTKKIVSGLPDHIVNELDKAGQIFLRPNTYGAGTGVNYNPERLKLVWDQELIRSGVNYLLHSVLVDVSQETDGRYCCIIWNKGGFFKVLAKRVIDASGDADFSHLAGFSYEIAGGKEPAQSMTTTFRMSNVDLNKFETQGGKTMLKEKMFKAYNEGRYSLPRKEGSAHAMLQEGCISTVAVKVSDLHALKIEDLTLAEVEGRKQAFNFEEFFRNEVPGYEHSNIIGLSHQIGIRETRRVYGNERLEKSDCIAAQIPKNVIFLCGAPIEDHRKGADGEAETYWQYIPDSGIYGVPYGTIVPKSSNTAWMIGRCFSASHDAHASCRSMAQTMSMGQAAGLAAVLSLEKEMSATSLDVSQLQNYLLDVGATLEIPNKTAETGRNQWSKNF